MNKHSILLFFLFTTLVTANLIAQQPENIYGKNRVLKPNTYYLEQIDLWKKVLDKNKKDANAWYNYYRANRNSYIVSEEKDTTAAKGEARFKRLEGIVLKMEKYVPKSFEYNYVKWLNGYNDLSLFPFLEKAHQIAPQRSEPLMDLVMYYEITGNNTLRDKNAVAYYNTGEYSPGLLNYAYNMLAGLDSNAIVFTEGDKDTEATWILQASKGFRTDVKLINLNLLFIKEYRNRLFTELGLNELDYEPTSSNEVYDHHHKTIIQHFTKNTYHRPVYVAVTVRNDYQEAIADQLYLTGLAYMYSNTTIDNISLLKKNIEEIYAMDYLSVSFPVDISQGNVNDMNKNYMPALSLLVEHYEQNGVQKKALYYLDMYKKLAQY